KSSLAASRESSIWVSLTEMSCIISLKVSSWYRSVTADSMATLPPSRSSCMAPIKVLKSSRWLSMSISFWSISACLAVICCCFWPMAFCTWAFSPFRPELCPWMTVTRSRRLCSRAAAGLSRFLASASSCRCCAMLDWICSSCFCRSETLAAEAASGTALAVTIRQSAAVSRQAARRIRSARRECFACFAVFTDRPPLCLYVQMLADGEQAAQAAHQRAARDAAGQDGGPHRFQGHQGSAHQNVPHASEAAGRADEVAVEGQHAAGRKHARDQAHGKALHQEGQRHQEIGGAHVLHDLDLAPAGKHAQAYGAAHRDDADHHQHQHEDA